MPTITFRYPDGREEVREAKAGDSIMQLAVSTGVSGIVGECGGACSCSTCHVFLEPRVYEMLDASAAIEDDLLDFTATDRRETSRLGCQVVITEQMDGMIIQLPETQV